MSGPTIDGDKLRQRASVNQDFQIIDIAPADDLAELPQRINAAVQAAEQHARSAVECALRAGELLMRAKLQIGHGQWEYWLQKNVSCAPRTAQAYMRLHQKMQTLPDETRNAVALLPLREAMKAIATLPKAIAPRRDPYMRMKARSEAQRVCESLLYSATHIRKFAHKVGGNYIKRKDYERLRKELQGTLEALDAFATHCDGEPPKTQITVMADDLRPLLDELDIECEKNAAHQSGGALHWSLTQVMRLMSTEAEIGVAKAKNEFPVIADKITLIDGEAERELNQSAIRDASNALIKLGKAQPGCRNQAHAAAAGRALRDALGVEAAA